jgi:hypothetical protein
MDPVLQDAPAEEYAGPATLSTGPATDGPVEDFEVEVRLRAQFEPLDGRLHWYGRIGAHDDLARRLRSGATVTVTTPTGAAAGRLSDVDPWGRFRISGTGRPPF